MKPTLPVACAVLAGTILHAACKKVGDLKTIDVAGDAQGDPSHPAHVRLTMHTGELHWTPGGAHVVGGAVRTNVADLEPKIEAVADRVTITQGGSPDAKWGADVVSDFRLTLGPTPLDLSADLGAANGDFELGGLAIKSASLRSGTGTVKIGFSSPNPLAADTLDIESGAGAVTLSDVARFGASKVRVHTGAGAIAITLGPVVDRDVTLDLEATAGAVRVVVPASTTARAEVKPGPGGITSKGWAKAGEALVLGGAGPSPRVTIRARAGTGAITLETTP